MFLCPHCGHHLCSDELRRVEQGDLPAQAVLWFRCQVCGKKSSFPVAQRALDHALRIEGNERLSLRPGTLVPECQSQEMIEFEKLGPITADEAIEFARSLESHGALP